MKNNDDKYMCSTFCASALLIFAGGTSVAVADEPCGELEACRAYIEINASDGDIGFHALFDAEEWRAARIVASTGKLIFKESVNAALHKQKMTENFFESAEPVCEPSLAEDEDDEVVTLPEFLERFPVGGYQFSVKLENGGELAGTTMFTHVIPAAPVEVDFDGSEISWSYGNNLGECTTVPSGFMVAPLMDIAGYEVVMAPEELPDFTFAVRVPVGTNSVTVPQEYLNSLPPDTPLKVEVGAIERRPNGSLGNQTFTEEDGFCNNADQDDCPDDDIED